MGIACGSVHPTTAEPAMTSRAGPIAAWRPLLPGRAIGREERRPRRASGRSAVHGAMTLARGPPSCLRRRVWPPR